MDYQLAELLLSLRALEMLSFIALYLSVVCKAKPLSVPNNVCKCKNFPGTKQGVDSLLQSWH
jgi:hypothetical protein